MEVVNAIGRRKAAVARVFVSEGTGKITINKRDLANYFPSTILQFIVKQPLAKLNDMISRSTSMEVASKDSLRQLAWLSLAHWLRSIRKTNPLFVQKVSLLVTRVLLNVRNRDVLKLVRDSSSVNVNLICESLTSIAKRLVSKLSGFFLYADIQEDYLMIELNKRK